MHHNTPHPLHYITTNNTQTQETFNNTDYTTDINTNPNTMHNAQIKTNMIYTTILNTYMNTRKHNKVTNTIPLIVPHSETTLSRATRRTLAQLRTNKMSYPNFIFKLNRRRQTPITTMPSLQNRTTRTTHLFNCTKINPQFKVTDLWRWRFCWMNGRDTIQPAGLDTD